MRRPENQFACDAKRIALNPRKLSAKHVEKSGNCGQPFTSRIGDYKIDGRRIFASE